MSKVEEANNIYIAGELKPLRILKTSSCSGDRYAYGEKNVRHIISIDSEEEFKDKPLSLAPVSEPKENLSTVVFAVSFYITTSILMVMVNKWVLNRVSLPLTFLWIQLIVAVILLQFVSMFGWLQAPTLNIKTTRQVMPLIIINVLGLTLNTLCLQNVDASFFQIARSLVLPFTVILSKLLLNDPLSNKILFACTIVFSGYIIGTYLEHTDIIISEIGVILGIGSSLTTAIHSIVIKQSLKSVKGSTLDLVYYNNILSVFMMLPILVVSGETDVWVQWIHGINEDDVNTLYSLAVGGIITGIFGFLINVAGFFQIKVTSPVSHMISSAFRGVLQTGVAVAVFGDVISFSRSVSIAFILSGSCFYAFCKSVRK